MRIRKAKKSDAKEIIKLRKNTFNRINSKDHNLDEIRLFNQSYKLSNFLLKMEKREMFCLIDNNQIVGVVDIEGNRVGGLFVKYKFIGKGYGKRLLEFIEKYALKKGYKKVKLYSSNFAENFYLNFGYKIVHKKYGKPVNGVRFFEIKMEKRL